MKISKRKIPVIKIDDINLVWLDNPICLEGFNAKIRKEFKNQWKQWLNKWILVVDRNNRLICKIRLTRKTSGELYPEIEGEKCLINLYAGILFTALEDLIRENKELKEGENGICKRGFGKRVNRRSRRNRKKRQG